MKISASIYSDTVGSLRERVLELDQHGIDFFHIDCRDNPAVFDDVASIRELSDTPIDLHLITPNPEKYFEIISQLGIEMVTLQYEELGQYEYRGGLKVSMGLSIVTGTDISAFAQFADQFDFILMMATVPGKSGGEFDKVNFRKIHQFKRLYPSKQVHVDGGVNAEVSFVLRNMGVQAAVVGSYLFRGLPVGAALLNLKLNNVESHFAVRDFMRSREESPILGPEKRSLAQVLQNIEDYRLGFTILEREDKTLEGIISNADLRREMMRKIASGDLMTVEGMVNRSPVCIHEQATVKSMLQMVKQHDFPINYLPVIDQDQRVTGVVSFLNLIKGEL